jgi:cytochrome b6-f complex iron-sulfur subunit
MVDTSEPVSRRGALLRALQASIAVTAAAVLWPVARFLRPRAEVSSGAFEVVAPYKVSDLKVNPAPPPFNFNGRPCLLALTADGIQRLAKAEPLEPGDVRAFNAVCTHLECTVEYRPAEGDIFCNCHNGVYDLNGHNVSGPPPRPLELYKVTLRGKRGEEEILVSRSS